MMKRLLVLALALALALGLCGCGKEQSIPTESSHTEPTLPDFNQSLSPEQHLQAAIEALEDVPFTAVCGSGWHEDITLTAGDEDTLRQLIPNRGFLSDFCAMGMMVVPSNDGTFRYEVTMLSVGEVCRLVCGRDLTPEEEATLSGYTDAMGSVAIYLDEDRAFQALEVDVTLDDSLWTLQIQITR